jgi:hypothetical protein
MALFTAYLEVKGKKTGSNGHGMKNGQKVRPNDSGEKRIIVPEGFFDDYAPADGWDPGKYSEIVKNGNSGSARDGAH